MDLDDSKIKDLIENVRSDDEGAKTNTISKIPSLILASFEKRIDILDQLLLIIYNLNCDSENYDLFNESNKVIIIRSLLRLYTNNIHQHDMDQIQALKSMVKHAEWSSEILVELAYVLHKCNANSNEVVDNIICQALDDIKKLLGADKYSKILLKLQNSTNSKESSNETSKEDSNDTSNNSSKEEFQGGLLTQNDNQGNKTKEMIKDDHDDKSNGVMRENDVKEYDEDDGDPIPSGTGSVSKDCSASELMGWSEILPKWHAKLNNRPRGLSILVRNGIPEPLRGEVWQLLSGAHELSDLMDKYRIFLTKTAPTEQIILRDVHRTYPAHENFRSDSSTSLTDSLFKVCKAYAVYDEEVGYCQGLSFLVAALLLHMPEEQAFCVFARIMQSYSLRDLFRNNFEELYLKFYQLERLLEEHIPDLHHHFVTIGIEPFTYASQWFLTVFTAKFPLNAVFYIMDIFLLEGMNTIFQIALALLNSSRQELLALDFEGVLRYFRVQMPKKYRNHENVKQLITSSSQMSIKKLKKHAKNYEIQQKEKLIQNPLTYIQLRSQLEILEDKTENLTKECQNHLNTISDMEDEKARLEIEVSQLKEVFRRELNRAESELARDNSIVSDYKKICSQLSHRLDGQLVKIDQFINTVQDLLRDNESCKEKSCYNIFLEKVEEFNMQLKDEDYYQQKQQQRRASGERTLGAYIKPTEATSSEVKIKHLTEHIDDLEVELARTKLALVEAECRCQQLTHDLSVGASIETTMTSASGLSSKLDFVRAAVNAGRPASVALAKINNLISEKISSPTTTTLDKC